MKFYADSIDLNRTPVDHIGEAVPTRFLSKPEIDGTFYLDDGTRMETRLPLTGGEHKELMALLERIEARAVTVLAAAAMEGRD